MSSTVTSPLLADVAGLRRFILSIMKRYRTVARIRGVPSEDLVNSGFLGLCEAAQRYDPARGCPFATYGAYWVRAMIGRSLSRMRPLHPVPVDEGGLPVELEAPPDPEPCAGADVAALLGCLIARERQVVELRFGLVDGRERTLAEVGEVFGLTHEWARKVLVRALGKMQRAVPPTPGGARNCG